MKQLKDGLDKNPYLSPDYMNTAEKVKQFEKKTAAEYRGAEIKVDTCGESVMGLKLNGTFNSFELEDIAEQYRQLIRDTVYASPAKPVEFENAELGEEG